MKVSCLAFTENGFALAKRLAQMLGGTAERCGQSLRLQQWTKLHFYQDRALVYVGAVGIAVRAIAPYLQSKTTDPAVVVVDECARFVVPLLSGHLGGANALARRIATETGAVPVLTTATDVHGIFAVDEWARCQHCGIFPVSSIRKVSGALLAGKKIRMKSDVPIQGAPPEGIELVQDAPYDVYVGIVPPPESVCWVLPKTVVLGIGCRKGTSAVLLEKVFGATQLPVQAICGVASIDLKAKEPGLLEFCQIHGWPLNTYRAAELAAVKGDFSASAFVEKTVGVDNVCERAAVRDSGGTLILRKRAGDGVTMAAAVRPFQMDWRFHHEW